MHHPRPMPTASTVDGLQYVSYVNRPNRVAYRRALEMKYKEQRTCKDSEGSCMVASNNLKQICVSERIHGRSADRGDESKNTDTTKEENTRCTARTSAKTGRYRKDSSLFRPIVPTQTRLRFDHSFLHRLRPGGFRVTDLLPKCQLTYYFGGPFGFPLAELTREAQRQEE